VASVLRRVTVRLTKFLARDVFIIGRIVALLHVLPSDCLSGTGVHCDRMVYTSARI